LILLGWTTQAFAQYIDPEMTGKALTRHYIEIRIIETGS